MAAAEPTTAAVPLVLPRTRAADYFGLTKPKIAVMALITVAVGYFLAAGPGRVRFDLLLHTLIGAGAVAAGGSALNHWLERRADARMRRTVNRPIPAGRVNPAEAFSFGMTLGVLGVGYLLITQPTPYAAIAAGLTFALYVGVYTPLKQMSAWNTVVGAVPGALPPVIGWCAAGGGATPEVFALFAILFVWQLPHFYAIAWLYRADYARGGMRMLPVVDRRDGRYTGWATALTAALLLAVTAGPFLAHAAGWVYLVGALPLGVWFLVRSVRFARSRNDQTARTVLRGSLVYLVGVMGLLVLDGVLPRYMGG